MQLRIDAILQTCPQGSLRSGQFQALDTALGQFGTETQLWAVCTL